MLGAAGSEVSHSGPNKGTPSGSRDERHRHEPHRCSVRVPTRHYYIPAGCAAEVRRVGTREWRVHCPTRDLWLPATGYDDGDVLFEENGWQLRVAGEIVGYSGSDAALVTITREMLQDAGRTPAGGHRYTRAQVAVFGVPWPLQKGWLSALVGRTVPMEQWERFVAAGRSTQTALC